VGQRLTGLADAQQNEGGGLDRRGAFVMRHCLVCFAIVAVACQAAFAADRITQFNRARRSAVPLLRSDEPADRIEGIRKLEDIPIAESVRLIQGSLGDSAASVRHVGWQALAKLSANQEVCDTLLLLARKSGHRKEDGRTAALLLAAALCSDLPSVQRDTAQILEKTTSADDGEVIAITMADELAGFQGPAAPVPLVKLSRTKVFADHFGVRRAVVQALVQIPNKEAVAALIAMLDQIKGEAGADAVEHLTHVTGQIYGNETAAWQRWWREAGETFEYPKRTKPTPYRGGTAGPAGDYYGLPLFAERLVFVIDTSGSMTGPRIVAAKRELIRAINGLPDHAHFGVVAFNGRVTCWHRELLPADAESKRKAIAFVESQQPESNTASYDALEAAFGFDTEAIYFLSDGAPHGGKIAAPVDIVTTITAANRVRRISIYTIGIGAGFPGGPLDLFLKTLAEQNLGLYRRIDG
jgi:hypothetical protein